MSETACFINIATHGIVSKQAQQQTNGSHQKEVDRAKEQVRNRPAERIYELHPIHPWRTNHERPEQLCITPVA